MTQEQFTEWRDSAKETLNSFDPESYTIENFFRLGSCLAILDHGGEATDMVIQQKPAKITPIEDSLKAELKDAEKYYDMWKRDGIEHYREMALDELKHFDYLYADASKTAYDREQQQYLMDLKAWRDAIAGRLMG